jgi:hypothetical protein
MPQILRQNKVPNRQRMPACFRNRVIPTAPPLRFVKSRLEEEERRNNRGHYTSHRVLLHPHLQNRLSESRLMSAVVVGPQLRESIESTSCRELSTPSGEEQMTAPAYIANVCDKVGNGDRRLDVMTLIRLADLYGKPPEFFLKPE